MNILNLMNLLTEYTGLVVLLVLISCYLAFILYAFWKPKKGKTLSDFEKVFISNQDKFLVFKPQLNIPNIDPGYGYFNLKGYDEWNFDKNDMQRRFDIIGGFCKECNKRKSLVGYYDSGYMKGFSDHNEWVIPQNEPLILCKICAFAKIKSVIEKQLDWFLSQLTIPYGGDGIYISTTTEK